MARYIDADALIKKIFPYDVVDKKCYTINAKMIYEEIQKAPTADVVPKSEVDRLEYTLLGVMHSVDKWLDGEELEQDEVNRAATMREKTLRIIENTKKEVTSAIFADIENAKLISKVVRNGEVIYESPVSLAELKKKYGVTDTNVGNKCTEEKE